MDLRKLSTVTWRRLVTVTIFILYLLSLITSSSSLHTSLLAKGENKVEKLHQMVEDNGNYSSSSAIEDNVEATSVNTIRDDKEWEPPQPCAIITCNRRTRHCCEGYHCSLQLLTLGGLGFCHLTVPNRFATGSQNLSANPLSPMQ